MAINKFQRSRLSFDLSVKAAHIGVHSIYYNIVFSEIIGPNELRFHIKTSYNKLVKIYANCFDHMTKMADMPIYGKNPLKIIVSRTRRSMTLGLGMLYWGCRACQV